MSTKTPPATYMPEVERQPLGFRESVSLLGEQLPTQAHKLFAHIPFLDGLRALSIFAVLTFHSAGPIGTYIFRKGGWVGVDAFFVISGFLITAILLKEQDKSGTVSLKNFYMRRALRLVPAFSLWIIVTSIVRIMHHKFSLASAGITAIYMCDYDLAMGWGNIMGSGFEVAWSLSIEEKFYLFWPSLVKYFRKSLPLIGVAAIVGCFIWRAYLLTHGANWLRICAAFDTKIDTLMIGCVSAMILNNESIKIRLQKYLKSALIPVGLLVFILFYTRAMGHPSGAHSVNEQLMYWNVRLPIFTFAVAALIVTLCVQPQSIVAKVLSFGPIAWVGKVSYSLYLWHIAAFAWAVWSGWQIRPLTGIEMEGLEYAWSLVFAAVSFYLIEKPFLRMKNRFTPAAATVRNSSADADADAKELVASAREKGR